jgi:hypothetical protein
MAKKTTARKQPPGEIEKRLGELEVALRGLTSVSKDLSKVRANLRKYLDAAEKCIGLYPRRALVRAKTRRP